MNLSDIEAAALRIAPLVHRTPIMTSGLLNTLLSCELYFKCEHLQKVGAFKARGASNAVAQLSNTSVGVATHSSGNHGAALAYAAQIKALPCYVVMPRNAPQVKKQAVAAYGAKIIECEPTLAAREQALASVVSQTGAEFVPPYDDERVIAGQGTAALEMLDQLGSSKLDVLLVPVGGGGLLAGTAVAAKGMQPSVQVFGVEPKGADDAARSFRSGIRVTENVPQTIADGLRTTLGEKNFPIILSQVDDILTVSEAAIIEAMKLIWTRLKQVIEPSSAVPLAAVLEHKARFAGKKVGVILSGGNVELSNLPF